MTTTVINDNGGTKVAGDFLVHVKQGATEAPKSPQNGNASGFTFTLTPGSYTVSVDGLPGYTAAISGDCDGKGAVTLAENQAKACTITRQRRRADADGGHDGGQRQRRHEARRATSRRT